MLHNDQCSASEIAKATLGRPPAPPPIGACMIPIVEDYLTMIRPGMRVLDIGCGSWELIRRHCQTIGASYDGIDIASDYFGVKTVATRLENLADLSFPDECFDMVLGNQSMEHWEEYGCTLAWGLYQCFRVCKPGGRVLLNVPFHYHGTAPFLLGRIETLRELFRPYSDRVEFHEWGNPSDPLPPYLPNVGYWRLSGRTAYVVDIHAVKDRPLPAGYSNRGAHTGRLAELMKYPFSFNIYRVLRKLIPT